MWSGSPLLRVEDVFEHAPFPAAHASTIVETEAGLVAAWFAGTREGHGDVGIWVARHAHGRWLHPVKVADGRLALRRRFPCWNPVLFQRKKGEPLLLFYKIGPSPSRWWGMLLTSEDAGCSWSEPPIAEEHPRADQEQADRIVGWGDALPVIGRGGALAVASGMDGRGGENLAAWTAFE